jgi:hypothetical protein
MGSPGWSRRSAAAFPVPVFRGGRGSPVLHINVWPRVGRAKLFESERICGTLDATRTH